MDCKNCEKEIIKVVDKWYHKDSQKWFCDTAHAEPKEAKTKK